MAEWLKLVLASVVGIVGLFIAASSEDRNAYALGLGLFVAGLACAFYSIKQYYDRIDRTRR